MNLESKPPAFLKRPELEDNEASGEALHPEQDAESANMQYINHLNFRLLILNSIAYL